MIPKDYACDGQLNIWDIMSQMEKPEEPEDELANDVPREGIRF